MSFRKVTLPNGYASERQILYPRCENSAQARKLEVVNLEDLAFKLE